MSAEVQQAAAGRSDDPAHCRPRDHCSRAHVSSSRILLALHNRHASQLHCAVCLAAGRVSILCSACCRKRQRHGRLSTLCRAPEALQAQHPCLSCCLRQPAPLSVHLTDLMPATRRWTMHCLAQNPQFVPRLQAEVCPSSVLLLPITGQDACRHSLCPVPCADARAACCQLFVMESRFCDAM